MTSKYIEGTLRKRVGTGIHYNEKKVMRQEEIIITTTMIITIKIYRLHMKHPSCIKTTD